VRKLGVLLGSVVAGGCWLLALFLPWTTGGALSAASLLDAVELIRRGAVDAIMPSEVAVLLLVPSVAGIVLIGAAGFAGRTATVLRVGALVVGLLGSLVLGWRLTHASLSAAGPGTWVALLGVAAAVQALGCAIYPVGAGRPRRPDS